MSRYSLRRASPLVTPRLVDAHLANALAARSAALRLASRPASRHPSSYRSRGFATNSGHQQSPPNEKRPPLRSRVAKAWSSTPTRWYPIPIALGGLVLLAVQYRKQSTQAGGRKDQLEVTEDGVAGATVRYKEHGPWQVRVLGALPLRSLSQLWGYLNGLVLPMWFRPFGFKLYATIFGCNLDEIEFDDLHQYESLGEFFYRRLKEGSRPIDASVPLVSPADGRVLHFGEIEEGHHVEQVKGMTYSLHALLGLPGQSVNKTIDQIEGARKGEVVDDEHFAKINDIDYSLQSLLGTATGQHPVKEEDTEDIDHEGPPPPPKDASVPHEDATTAAHDANVAMSMGTAAALGPTETDPRLHLPKIRPGNKLFFMVVYLAPGDYHRFHSPAAWVVEKRRHFTGDLFSVSPYIANRLKNLFVLNERVALIGRWRYGFFSMTPVGATNVGSILINFDQSLRTNTRHPTHPPHTFTEAVYTRASAFLRGQPLAPGEEMGGFRLGSTIVMVFEAPEGFKFDVNPGDRVKVGQRMGVLDQE